MDLDFDVCTEIPEKLISTKNPLTNDPGMNGDENAETFQPPDLSIPDVPEGSYYLVFYVDDTDEVSEFNEVNNWIAVPVTIEEPNEPPVIALTHHVIDEDTAPSAVLATDSDDDVLTITILAGPDHGTVTTDGGSFTYTPDTNFNGDDSFDFEVSDGEEIVAGTLTIEVTPVNDPPEVSVGPVTVKEDESVVVVVTATDVDGDELSFAVSTDPANGTAESNSDGTFTYTPNADFYGTDTFSVTVNDTVVDVTVTVDVTITAVNDAPMADSQDVVTMEDTPLNGSLVGQDIDGDDLTFVVGTAPAGGTVVVDSATGTFTYTPAIGFLGIDSFAFRAFDGDLYSDPATVTINVIDPVPNWDFIGFSTPWRPNYKVKAGSAIPLKWYYADPDSGSIVSSYDDGLEITATGYTTCDPTGDPMVVLALPEDAGSSDLRYNDGDWQLNWDTAGLETGCYFLSIYHPFTNQIDTENHNGALLTIQLK